MIVNGGAITINARFNVGKHSDGYITMNGGTFTVNGPFKFPDDPDGVHRIYLNAGLMHCADMQLIAERDAIIEIDAGMLKLDNVIPGDPGYDPTQWVSQGALLPADAGDEIFIEYVAPAGAEVTAVPLHPDRAWTNGDPADDSWCTPDNWAGGQVPGPADVAFINPPPSRGPIISAGCNANPYRIQGPVWQSSGEQVMDITGGTVVVNDHWQWGWDGAGTAAINISGSPSITVNGIDTGDTNYHWRGAEYATGILNISGNPTINVPNGRWRGGDKAGSVYIVNMSGGNVNCGGVKLGDEGTSEFNLSGGAVNVTGDFTLSLLRGDPPPHHTVNVSGGLINVAGVFNAHATLDFPLGTAVVNLCGGTIECAAFAREAGYLMDIMGGTLIIHGDVTAAIAADIGAGYIVAYAGCGTVQYDYDQTNPGRTTVTASGPPTADSGGPYVAQATDWDGADVQLNGAASCDPAGVTLTYEWDLDLLYDSDFDGDPTNDVDQTGPNITKRFPIGQRDISLVVSGWGCYRSEPAVTTVTVSLIDVDIDIKPGSWPNCINLGSHGTIPVAFLSDPGFDALTIYPSTVTLRGEDFESGLVAVRGKKNPELLAEPEDVDGDGDLDLVVHLETETLAGYDLDAVCVLGAKTQDGYVVSGTDILCIKGLTAFKVDIGAEGQEVEPGFIGWSPPPAGDPSGDTVLLDIGTTRVNAKLETGLGNTDLGFRGPGIIGVRPYQGQNYVANDFLHSDNYGGGEGVAAPQCPSEKPLCEPGKIVLTLSNLSAGDYQLTGWHNEPRLENHSGDPDDIGVSPLNVRITGAVSAAAGDTNVIVTGRDTDENIGTSISTFTATGKGDVIIEWVPDGSKAGPSLLDPEGLRNLWDRAWLNAFELRSQ
jgi:hypothetical protein